MLDTKPVDYSWPAISMKRNQYARARIADTLVALGLPAMLDASHIVMTGIDSLARWLVLASDTRLEALFSGNDAKFKTAVDAFRSNAPPFIVRHVTSPGISMRGNMASIDGCTMCVWVRPSASTPTPNDLQAFVVPVTKEMLLEGQERVELVGMIPTSKLNDWMLMLGAARSSDRMLQVDAMMLMVHNGPDVKVTPVSLESIVMDDVVRSDFIDDLNGFLSRRDWYAERGLPWTRKYLLNGPPGTGKTMLTRWAISNLGMPAVSFDFSDKYADGRDFTMFFNRAARRSPCLVVLDDIDKVLTAGNNGTGVTPHSMLTTLSGVGSIDGVVVVATSNSVEPFMRTFNDEKMPPLMRRFDAIINVPLPTAELRRTYLQRVLSKEEVSRGTVEHLANNSNGWSYDDLRAVITAAANFMIAGKRQKLNDNDVLRGARFISNRLMGGATQ